MTDYNAPGIPQKDGEIDQKQDTTTRFLSDQLNSLREIPYTQPSYNRDYILGGGIADSDYDVGYKHVPVDNQVSVLPVHYESPNTPVTQLPYNQSLVKSTKLQPQVTSIQTVTLRAPGINEGF